MGKLPPLPAPESALGSPQQPANSTEIEVVVVSAVRLLGEGLERALSAQRGIAVVGVAQHLGELRELPQNSRARAAIALVDVSGDIDLDGVRLFAAERPDMKLLALGLVEQRAEVIRCAKAGFCGYIARNTRLDDLGRLLSEAARGGTSCSAEIATGLMQALFRPDFAPRPLPAGSQFTPREGDILRLLGRGFSNKAIARELTLSAATVKNHVHNILAKAGMSRRGEVARTVREQPWIAGPHV